MALSSKQKQRIIELDAKVKQILEHGGGDEELLISLADKMEVFNDLIRSGSPGELNTYCEQYDSFYRYMNLLENLARFSSENGVSALFDTSDEGLTGGSNNTSENAGIAVLEKMFQTSDYDELDDSMLIELEFTAMNAIGDLSERLSKLFMDYNIFTSPELSITDFCFFLGILMTSILGVKNAQLMQENVINLYIQSSIFSHEQFNQYRVNSSVDVRARNMNLTKLSDSIRGSIVNQTVKLGKRVFDHSILTKVNARSSPYYSAQN